MDFLDYKLFEIGGIPFTPFSLISVLSIMIVAWISVWSLNKVIHRRLIKNQKHTLGRAQAVQQISKYFIYSIALIVALQFIGLKLEIVIASSAALFVGLGFGLQNTFNDFVSGFILLFDGTIEVGDTVEVGGLVGRVKHIGLRTTKVLSRDSIGVIIPNSKFTGENVINWTHAQVPTRFNVKVGVAYGSPVKEVMSLMEAATLGQNRVLPSPAPLARFLDFGDSALLFEVLFWTHDSFSVEFTRSDIRKAIDDAFREHGIKIPFPQRDLHLISMPENPNLV